MELKEFLITYLWLRWVFVAACGLSSSCGEWGLLREAVHGLLVAASSLGEHRLSVCGQQRLQRAGCSRGSQAPERMLSSCGTRT